MLSRLFLIKNKKCCGNGCLMCPYEPKHLKGSTEIRQEVLKLLSEEELNIVMENDNDNDF
ncbi:MAG: hypothetical protein CMG25_06285 [Candidatus Marinimicrobia bacterium]|nr:hypothetical protein [Candidatus Neomarinimicrobiota bacterium]|tara:strand:+ start:147 stop:326 length:180 start_codon:yes stop_codon:yes gene_type:complete